jgi:hypothetical protein
MSSKPLVLVVDDRSDEEKLRSGMWGSDIEVVVEHPQDVTEDQLLTSSLVLVDYRIEDWSERDNSSCLALQPANGLALASVLREHVQRDQDRAIAFAIHSAHLPDLTGGLPPEFREHVVARAHNLEWVFPKGPTHETRTRLYGQIPSLASAVRELPGSWTVDDPEQRWEIVKSLLALRSDAIWVEAALEDVRRCHPPVHELSERSHGLAFLRWLLHRILPYPCFLWDTHRLSARLRVTHESLLSALERDTHLAAKLMPLEYSGILDGFLGKRWWGAAIEALLWDVSEGNPFDSHQLRSVLQPLAGNLFEFDEVNQPVVVVNSDYQPISVHVDIDDAVRIQPDDWPVYADQAWITVDLARTEPTLRSLVVPEDLPSVQ